MISLLSRILRSKNAGRPVGPESLYRYQTFSDWLKPVIVNSELYFPLSKELNDPCEYCYRIDIDWNDELARRQIEWLKANCLAKTAVEQANPGINIEAVSQALQNTPTSLLLAQMRMGFLNQTLEQREAMIQAQLQIDATTIGVSCFTTHEASGYMSYFYADKHAGVCLEFATGQAPFSMAVPVEYCAAPGVVRLISDPKKPIPERMLMKGLDWSQENEWRIINHRVNQGSTAQFPPDALLSITIGSKFSTSNLELLKEWLDARRKRGGADLATFEFRRNQASYKLERRKLDVYG